MSSEIGNNFFAEGRNWFLGTDQPNDYKEAVRYWTLAEEGDHEGAATILEMLERAEEVGYIICADLNKWDCNIKEGEPEQEESVREMLLQEGIELVETLDEFDTKVLKRLEEGAQAGDAESLQELVQKYYAGDGVERDPERALFWLKLGVERSDIWAQVYLAHAYDEGDGVDQDDREAVRLYRLAAEQGDSDASFYLAQKYYLGDGVEQDCEYAVQVFQELVATDSNSAPSNSYCKTLLGDAYEHGDGIEKDLKKAIRWYREAAEEGEEEAQFSLGDAYHHGEMVKKNRKLAIRWYREAAENGHAGAQRSLGVYYSVGLGVRQDAELAMHWLELAAEQGEEGTQLIVGHGYKSGEGVEESSEQAFSWWKLGAESGDAACQCCVGECYLEGHGVEQDRDQALHWLRLSAEQEDEDALALLEKLGADVKEGEVISFPRAYREGPKQRHSTPSINELLKLLDEKQAIIDKFTTERSPNEYSALVNVPVSQIIAWGENQLIEFKETFSYNTKAKRSGDQDIRHAVLRGISSFLNTKGGVLIIGASDDQGVTGIERDDYQKDENYIRTLSSVIAEALGAHIAALLEIKIVPYRDKKLCCVWCPKSNVPVYCTTQKHGEQTFIRYGNVTKVVPPSEWKLHCEMRF